MTADLGKYTDLHIFAKEFPDRFYQMGMAEQLLMGAAGGMAHEGFDALRHHLRGVRLAPGLRLHPPGDRRGEPQRQDLLRPAGPDHRLRPEPPGDRGHRDVPRHAGPDDRRSLRRARDRAGGAAPSPRTGPGLHAPAARQRAAGAGRVRLPVRARQGEAAARRRRRARHLLRLHDHARAGSRPRRWRPTGGRRGAARARRSSRWTRQTILREAARTGRWWSWPRTTPSSAAWARRSPRRCCAPACTPKFRQIGLPDEFLRRRRAADAARPLRHLGRGHGHDASRAGWGKAAANTTGIGRQSVTQGRFGHDDGRFHRSRSHGPAHGEEPRGARLHRPRLRHEDHRRRCSGRGGRRAGSLRRRGGTRGRTSWC